MLIDYHVAPRRIIDKKTVRDAMLKTCNNIIIVPSPLLLCVSSVWRTTKKPVTPRPWHHRHPQPPAPWCTGARCRGRRSVIAQVRHCYWWRRHRRHNRPTIIHPHCRGRSPPRCWGLRIDGRSGIGSGMRGPRGICKWNNNVVVWWWVLSQNVIVRDCYWKSNGAT